MAIRLSSIRYRTQDVDAVASQGYECYPASGEVLLVPDALVGGNVSFLFRPPDQLPVFQLTPIIYPHDVPRDVFGGAPGFRGRTVSS